MSFKLNVKYNNCHPLSSLGVVGGLFFVGVMQVGEHGIEEQRDKVGPKDLVLDGYKQEVDQVGWRPNLVVRYHSCHVLLF
jgi:hypothetical protein